MLALLAGLAAVASLPGQGEVYPLFLSFPLNDYAQAPGTEEDNGIFVEFGVPSIGADGTVAFQAELNLFDTVTNANNEGVWAGAANDIQLVAREGSPAPAFPESENVLVSHAGATPAALDKRAISFQANVSGASVGPGINYLGLPSGLVRALEEGTPIKGTPLDNFTPFLSNGRELADGSFEGWLSGIARFTGEGIEPFVNDQAVVLVRIADGNAALTEIARLGDSVQGANATLTLGNSSIALSGLNAEGASLFSVSATGVFEGQEASKALLLMGQPNGDVEVVFESPDPDPGVPNSEIPVTSAGGRGLTLLSNDTLPGINAAGEVVFVSSIHRPPDRPDDPAIGIFGGAPGALEAWAVQDDPAPGAGGRTFRNFQSVVLNNGGEIAFIGQVEEADGSVNQDADQGLWAGPPESLELVAMEGDPMPGITNIDGDPILFSGFTDPMMNARGQVVFGGTANIIWLYDPDLPEGERLQVISQNNVTSVHLGEDSSGELLVEGNLSYHSNSGGGDGRLRSLDDEGRFVFRAVRFSREALLLNFDPGELPGAPYFWRGAEATGVNWHTVTESESNWKDDVDNVWEDPPGDEEGTQEAFIEDADVELQDRAARLRSLDATGSLEVDQPLTLEQASAIEALTLRDDLVANGALLLSGDSRWIEGLIDGQGEVAVTDTDSVLDIGVDVGPTVYSLAAPLRSGAQTLVSLANGHTLNLTDGQGGPGQLVIGPDSLFDLSPDTDITSDVVAASHSDVLLQGRMEVEDGAEIAAFFRSESGSNLLVESGTLAFSNVATLAGAIAAPAGASVEFADAVVTLEDGFSIEGEGSAVADGFTLQVAPGAATANLPGGDGFRITGDTNFFGSGTYVNEGATTVDSPDVTVDTNIENNRTFVLRNGADVIVTASRTFRNTSSDTLSIENGETIFGEMTNLINQAEGKLQIENARLIIEGKAKLEGEIELLGDTDELKFPEEPSQVEIKGDLEIRGKGLIKGGATIDEGASVKNFSDAAFEDTTLTGANPDSISSFVNQGDSSFENSSIASIALENAPNIFGILEFDNVTFEGIDLLNSENGEIDQQGKVLLINSNSIRSQGVYKLKDDILNPEGSFLDSQFEVEDRLIVSPGGGEDGIFVEADTRFNKGADVVVESNAKVTFGRDTKIILFDNDHRILVEDGGEVHFFGVTEFDEDDGQPLKFGQLENVSKIGKALNLTLNGSGQYRGLPISEAPFENEGRLALRGSNFVVVGEAETTDPGSPQAEFQNRGTLILRDGSTVTARSFENFESGIVKGSGKILAILFNDGLIDLGVSPGAIEIDGDYTQGATGILEIELGGLEAGFDFDQLIVSGAAAFEEGATIRITLIDPNPDDDIEEIFVPRDGDAFPFLAAESVELPEGATLGDFVEFANLPDGVELALDLAVVDGMSEVRLAVEDAPPPPLGPRIVSHPKPLAAAAGSMTTLRVAADGAEAFAYQWRRNGADIPGATDPTFTLPSVQPHQAGEYSVVVTADGVSVESRVAELETLPPAPSPARLLNLSTRVQALTGDNVPIAGFVITGSEPRRLLVRSVGPGLSAFDIANPLPDPQMRLLRRVDGQFEEIAANDDWQSGGNAGEIPEVSDLIGAFPLADDRESALLGDFEPGIYTAIASGKEGATGVSLIELFDAGDADVDARLVNISTRGIASVGENVMIPGFVISAEGPKTVLVRVAGPVLAEPPFSVPGTLEDPKLIVFRQEPGGLPPTRLFENDDWGDAPDPEFVAQTAQQVGAFAFAEGSADAALVLTLEPGVYTMVGSAPDAQSAGVVLVEVFVVE